MIRSKYLGRTYDAGWEVTAVELQGRYGKRKKRKGNTYNFVLSRSTSDNKCHKQLRVNHNQMCSIDRGLVSVEDLEKKSQLYTNASVYSFYKNN